MEKRFELGHYGGQLWTREKAREIRAALQPMLDELGQGDTLVIDTKGVEVFDYSFANEFFGKTALAMPREHPGRFAVVEYLTRYTRENLANALESMGLAMIERKGDGLVLIGKANATDEKTFAAIAHAGRPVTAVELSEKLKVSLNAMNERLSKLVDLGFVRREKSTSPAGREQYEYHVLS